MWITFDAVIARWRQNCNYACHENETANKSRKLPWTMWKSKEKSEWINQSSCGLTEGSHKFYWLWMRLKRELIGVCCSWATRILVSLNFKLCLESTCSKPREFRRGCEKITVQEIVLIEFCHWQLMDHLDGLASWQLMEPPSFVKIFMKSGCLFKKLSKSFVDLLTYDAHSLSTLKPYCQRSWTQSSLST